MTDMQIEPERIPETDAETKPVAEDELVKLLAAFQFLQGQNMKLASELCTRLGIGPTDLRVLLYIDRTTDVTPKEVAAQLKLTSGSITALVDRLERSDHVLRRPHPHDRRSLTLRLTDTGNNAVRAVRDAYHSSFTGVFSNDEVGHVASILQLLGTSLDRAIAADSSLPQPSSQAST